MTFTYSQETFASVKILDKSERERLKEEINRTDPTSIFGSAKDSSNPDKRYIICPICGNGTGSDATPVEVKFKNGVWVYNCFKCNAFHGDLVKIIATEGNYNLNTFEGFCQTLAAGADLIGYNLDSPVSIPKKQNPKPINNSTDARAEVDLIKADIAQAQKNLPALPEEQRRGLTLSTLAHFGFGYLEKWATPKSRLDTAQKVCYSKRIIIPTLGGSHYNAVALNSDRRPENKQYWKMHSGKMELFNSNALKEELILVVEGELDAASIFQAFEGKIGVVATLGAANWSKTLLPALKNLRGKNFVILFDGDNAGRNNSDSLCTELRKRGFLAVSFFFYDELMAWLEAPKDYPEIKFRFDSKIDANDILVAADEYLLRVLTQKIIANAEACFEKLKTAPTEPSAQVESNTDYFSGAITDAENAKRLEKYFGDRVKFLDDLSWLIWGKHHWEIYSDAPSVVLPFISEFADELITQAKNIDSEDAKKKSKKAFALAYSFQKRKDVNNAIFFFKGRARISSKDLDNHPDLLSCPNGVIELESGSRYQADEKLLYLTQQVTAPYFPDADTAQIDKFLNDIFPDKNTLAALIRWLGYCLTGSVREEIFMIWQGSGANGKGTLSKIITRLFGSYAAILPSTALCVQKFPDPNRATTALNGLNKARFAISEELPQNYPIDSSLLKNLTGGDDLILRELYQKPITVKATAKINISGNFTPRLENFADEGLRRRLRVIPFTESFTGNNADPHLKEKLLLPDNQRALLKILVDAAKVWYEQGLIFSAQMKDVTEERFAENDFISDFIANYVRFDASGSVFRQAVLKQLKENYRQARPFSDNDLLKLFNANSDIKAAIDARTISYKRETKGYSYKGISLGSLF